MNIEAADTFFGIFGLRRQIMDSSHPCSHDAGFYIKMQLSFHNYFDTDGYPSGSEQNETAVGRGGTVAYCTSCEKRLGVVEWNDGIPAIVKED